VALSHPSIGAYLARLQNGNLEANAFILNISAGVESESLRN
jgi:hypothetical protein